ncbi:MAG: TetR/AcrR family transcriptional regulator [Solirubrobacterales bacterium]
MAPPTRTPERGRRAKRPTGDARELLIRETLESLLETKSFHEISIDDLAKGAGISRPSFYFYFESKEAVLLALLDTIVSQADAASDAAQAALDQDPAHFLRDALTAYFHYFGAHRAVSVAGTEAGAGNPRVRTLWNQVRERWVAAATAGIEAERARGSAPDGPPARDLAIALINMNEGVLFSAFAGEQPAIVGDHVVDVLTDVWLKAIYDGRPPEATQT